MGCETSLLNVLETLSRLIESNPKIMPMRGPNKHKNLAKEKNFPVAVKRSRKRRVGLGNPLTSSLMAIPTMEATITPTMTIRAEIRRNRVLLNWSSISFLKIVRIPCTSDLLKVLHVNLFEGVVFFVHTQLVPAQLLNGTHSDQIPLDHDAHSVTDPLHLLEKMGGKEDGHLLFFAQGS